MICLEKPYNGQQEDFLGCLVTGKRLILLSTYFAKETTCHACINSVRPKLKLIFQHFFCLEPIELVVYKHKAVCHRQAKQFF